MSYQNKINRLLDFYICNTIYSQQTLIRIKVYMKLSEYGNGRTMESCVRLLRYPSGVVAGINAERFPVPAVMNQLVGC